MSGKSHEERVFAKWKGNVGPGHERHVTAKDLRNAGVEDYDGEDIKFTRANRYMVDVTDLPVQVREILAGEADVSVGTSERPPKLATDVVLPNNEPTASAAGGPGIGATGTVGTGSTTST